MLAPVCLVRQATLLSLDLTTVRAVLEHSGTKPAAVTAVKVLSVTMDFSTVCSARLVLKPTQRGTPAHVLQGKLGSGTISERDLVDPSR